MKVTLRHPVLKGNQITADQNRALFRRHAVRVLNLMSSPGAGKTTFLERWIPMIQGKMRIGVIEGDVATTLDAQRIAATGAQVVQINTHGACHLDAGMIDQVLDHFDLTRLDFLVIENVGNLVCPAEFDLGETLRITLLSTTEGDDKPLKYPASFRGADAVLLNKIDLLSHVPFQRERFSAALKDLNPEVPVFEVSALTGEGMDLWTRWLQG